MTEVISGAPGWGPLSGETGYALVFGLCALLFIEECGIPMPFAPGDLVLLLCGITVAADHLNVAAAIACVTISIVAGALTGRELFSRAGSPLAYRIADLFRLRAALDRMASALRRHGWYGVLIGRLTPGLRVHTTEAAGLIGMPRRTFAAGLIPAVAIYEGVFIGLGLWLGPAANYAIHDYTPKLGPLIVLLAAAVGVIAIARWLHGFLKQRAPTRRVTP